MIYNETFSNGVALQSHSNTYDEVSKSKSVSVGDNNHSESTFTATYETLNAGSGVYSEVTAQCATHVQVRNYINRSSYEN